jgi:hypothetical protein
MENLALSALQLEVNLVHYSVYRYQIVYQKFDETASGEQLARKVAYELQRVNGFAVLTNLGNRSIISLKPISQLVIDSPQLQASVTSPTKN